MKKFVFALVLGVAMPAYAGEVADKCVDEMNAAGAPNAEAVCSCFEETLDDGAATAFLAISDWEGEATDEMREAADACEA